MCSPPSSPPTTPSQPLTHSAEPQSPLQQALTPLTTPSTRRSHPPSPPSFLSSPGIAKPSTRYRSTNLAKLDPSLAFKKRDSVCVAAAAVEADDCRDRFKAARDSLVEAAYAARDGDTAEDRGQCKDERRRLLNRSSASASRLRKEAYCTALERELEDLERNYNALLVRATALEKKQEERVRRKVERGNELSGESESDTRTSEKSGGRQDGFRKDDHEVGKDSSEAKREDEGDSPGNMWAHLFDMNANVFGNDPSTTEPSSDLGGDTSMVIGLDLPSFLS